MTRRIVVPEGSLVLGEIAFPDELSHYVRRVLRLEIGEEVEIFDGAGAVARGVLTRSGAVVGSIARAEPPPGAAITLLQGIGKGEKMDAVVRQATELGVRRIVPVASARAVARQEGRVDRWRAIAEDAIRVSGRPLRPAIEPVVGLDEVLGRPRGAVALCFTGDATDSLAAAVQPEALTRGVVEILIGPEGGLAPEEVISAVRAGFTPVHLGPHTLRTETAGPAVVAILQHLAGGLG